MKKMVTTVISVLLVLTFAVSMIAVTAYADDWGAGTYKVTASSLSVRSIPSTDGTKLGKLVKGNTVIIDEIQDGWGHMTYNSLTGWVSMDYMAFESFSTFVPRYGHYVNCNTLNVRAKNNSKANILTTLKQGTEVTVIKSYSNGWSNITAEGVTGWVVTKYLSKKISNLDEYDTGSVINKCKTKSNTNLRTGPGSVYNVRMVIPAGSEITISKVRDGFAFTVFEDTLGWVSVSLLDYLGKSESNSLEQLVRPAALAAGDGAVYATGIDLSKWNGTTIDWPALKQSGVDFVILRVGTTYGIDSAFETNYAGAKSVGLDVGAYFYTYAQSTKTAKKDAEMCSSWLEGKQFEYPIFYDIEEVTAEGQINLSKKTCTALCTTFCDALLDDGWYPGVFTMKSWWSSKLDYNVLSTKYEAWVSHLRSNTDTSLCSPSGQYDYASQYGMFQWSWYGSYKAIKYTYKGIDMDVAYKDYPKIIKEGNYNGFNGETTQRSAYLIKPYGDATNDTEINMYDVVYMQQVIAKLAEMTEEEFELSDVNGDESLTLDDVVELQKYIAGLTTGFTMG